VNHRLPRGAREHIRVPRPTIERPEDHPLWGIIGIVDDPDAPTDGSINHDHYIYGVPRKYPIPKKRR